MANLENYSIIKNLGSGAFGQVKRNPYSVARHILTQTPVAIKVIKKKLAQEQGVLRNIKFEARFLQSFSHPNIIKLFEYIKTDSVHYLVLEYVSGGELYSLLEKRGKLTESEAKKLFFQILSAVEYCHKHGIAHRDLKPENILLDEFRNIKLGDFGLSGTMKDGEFMKTPCGSANYAAPEIVSGQKYAGTEVDVWSLGVLLFTLLAGSLPFDEASMPLLISKIKEARFRIPYHFTAQAADLIKRMIVVNPLHRLSITEILRHPWISSTFPQSPLSTPCPITIDEEIFTILFSFPQFSLEEKKEEKRQKILSFDYSDLFSVSYFMLLHQKRKNQGHTTCSKRVFKQVNLTSKLLTAPNTWKFCFHLEDSLEKVIENICKTLKALNCFWKFSTPFYMKIVKKNLYKKIYLKFELRVYIADNVKEGKKFLVDFRLLTGCSLTFLDFCSEFFALSKCILS